MIQPAKIDISADRWVACIRTMPIVNADLTGAAFKLQVRAFKDVAGTPLADLNTQTSAAVEGVRLIDVTTSTVAAHIAAGRLVEIPSGYASTDSVIVSRVGIRINETTMEAMAFPSEIGDDARYWWDIHITPAGGIKDVYAAGQFIVRAGATL